MCSKRFRFEPTHVYANICPQLLSSDSCNKEDQLSEKNARKIEVSGTAEHSLPPDECVLTVVISNKKEKAEDARTSVTRRLDYVTQMLYNHGIPKSHVEVTKNMSRVNNGRGWFIMEAQIDAVFSNDLHKCLQMQNLFVEKLDKCVQVLPIKLQHNKQNVDALRKKTCLAALTNARQKASEVCRVMGQSLGRPVFVTENIIREWRGESSEDAGTATANIAPRPPPKVRDWSEAEIDIQRRVKEQSLSVKVDVTATFDINCKFDRCKQTKIISSDKRKPNCVNKYN